MQSTGQIANAVNAIPNSKPTHSLPLEIILFHMVDFSKIKGLPLNQDCTHLLKSAAQRVLNKMFHEAEYSVESFMPRCTEFQRLFIREVEIHGQAAA